MNPKPTLEELFSDYHPTLSDSDAFTVHIRDGELFEDGKHFRKDDQITKDFVQSKAYEEILNDFFDGEHETMVKDFVLNVFPKKYKDGIAKQMANGPSVIPVKK